GIRPDVAKGSLAHRKAITTRDVIHALKRQGGILYGFE
ncbi:hypothetical protein L915_13307, partial [Phytophthora nicotianae]